MKRRLVWIALLLAACASGPAPKPLVQNQTGSRTWVVEDNADYKIIGQHDDSLVHGGAVCYVLERHLNLGDEFVNISCVR